MRLGPFLCLLLKIFHQLQRAEMTKETLICDAKHILIIKFFGMGTILKMIPMLKILKKNCPDGKICLLTFSQNTGLAKIIPEFDEIITIPFDNGFWLFLVESFKDILLLRKKKFDVIFSCEFFSYFTSLVAHLIRQEHTVIVGFLNNKWTKDWIYDFLVAIDNSKHISFQFCKMLFPFGLKEKTYSHDLAQLMLTSQVEKNVNELLNELQIHKGHTLIAVNINTSPLCLNRRWPLEYFQSLINMILVQDLEADKIRLLLIGGKEDQEYVNDFIRRFDNHKIHNLAAILTMPELAACFQRCHLFIGNDSGPMHLAFACGLPSISFFGPETPNMYGPGQGHHHVFYANLHCSPCLNIFYSKKNSCQNNECMKAIHPNIVYQKVEEFLSDEQQ